MMKHKITDCERPAVPCNDKEQILAKAGTLSTLKRGFCNDVRKGQLASCNGSGMNRQCISEIQETMATPEGGNRR